MKSPDRPTASREALSRRLRRALAVAGLLASARTTQAQISVSPLTAPKADTGHLAPVVVTATRVPFKEVASTTSTTVITGQELEARGITTVVDALRDVAGADPVQTGSMGGLTSLFLRGGESGYAKVLVDGVPLNEPGGVYYFQNLTTADIDRIEIVRGPTSVLYGTDAMTGVIQIFTKRGTGPTQASIDLRGGSYKSFDGSADIEGGSSRVGYSIGGARQTTAGILPFNNQFTNGELGGRIDVGRGTTSTASLTARYHTGDYHYPTVGDGTPVDSNQHRRDEGSSFALEGAHQFSPILDGRLSLTDNNEDAANIAPQENPADTLGSYDSFNRDVFRRLGADAHFDAHAGNVAVVTVGGDLEGQTDRNRSFDVSNYGGVDTSISGPAAYFRRVEAGYAQLLANLTPKATISAGGRIDHNSAFGNFATYRLGGGYVLAPGTQVHGNVGTAFKEPTFEENFSTAPFDVGNPALLPERSTGWELGLTEAPVGSNVSLSATYFNQRFHNIVDYSPAEFPVPGHAPDSSNYINIAGATADGIEGNFLAGPINGATLDVSYTWLDTRVTNNGVDTSLFSEYRVGTRLIRRPSHQFSGMLRQDFAGRGSLGVTVRFIGTRDDINFNALTDASARVVLPGYTTVDLMGDLRLTGGPSGGPTLSLIARASNLLDRQYQEVYSYAAPGRVIMVGARISAGGK